MAHPEEHLAVLTTRPDETDGAVVVAALADRGITATMGNTKSAHLVPGFEEVEILVRQADLPRAQEILGTLEEDRTDVDWSEVDVGEAEEEE